MCVGVCCTIGQAAARLYASAILAVMMTSTALVVANGSKCFVVAAAYAGSRHVWVATARAPHPTSL